jgi:tetratricopeptide (TPR) repeat protein
MYSWLSNYIGNCMKYLAAILLALLAVPVLPAQPPDEGDQLDNLLAQARVAQAKDDFVTAEQAYRQAVRLRPDIPELWANLGLMQHQTGEKTSAMVSFRKALALNSKLFVPNLFLGIDLVDSRSPGEAVPYLLVAEKLQPADVQGPLALGRAYAASQKTLDASDAYGRVLSINPGNSDAWFGLGMMSLRQVEADTRRLISESPKSSYLTSLQALVFSEEGKLSQATEQYKVLLASPGAPSCSQVEYALVLARQQAPADELIHDSKCAIAPLARTNRALRAGAYNDAWHDLLTLDELSREVLRANMDLLWTGLSPQQLEPVENSLGSASSQLPEDVLAALRLSLHRTTPEVELFASRSCGTLGTKGTSVASSAGTLSLVECAYYTGDYRKASQEARRLTAVAATHTSGLYWEIRADQRLATAALAQAEETAPQNSSRIAVLIGDLYRQKQQYDAALSEYQKALRLSPSDAGAMLGIATTYFLENKKDEALAAAQTALAADPTEPRLNLLVGEVLTARGNYPDAELALRRSLKADPELLPRVHELLGRCYASTKKVNEAIREYTLALPGDQDGSIHYQLARLYRENGDLPAMKAALEVSAQLHKERLDRAYLAMAAIQQASSSPKPTF